MRQSDTENVRHDKIMSLKVLNPWITNAEIAKVLGVSEATVSREVGKLVDSQRMTQINFPAKGKYIQQYDTFYVFIETSFVGAKDGTAKKRF